MVSGYLHNIRLRATAEANQTNVPMKLTIARGAGDNTASIIYLNNNALNWPYDVRFTNASGEDLDFWREEYDSEDGTWWIKIDSITANEISYIYLYYGKAGDSDADSGPDGIVTFFDDFESGDLSKWSLEQAGPGGGAPILFSVQSTEKYEGSYAVEAIHSRHTYYIYQNLSLNSAIAIELACMLEEGTGAFDAVYLTTASGKHINALSLGHEYFYYNSDFLPIPYRTNGEWNYVKIIVDVPLQKISWYIDGAYIGQDDLKDLTHPAHDLIGTSDFITKVQCICPDGDDLVGYIDHVLIYPHAVAKWLSPETEEVLTDGLYVVERKIDYSLKPEETLRAYAYNDHALDFYITRGDPISYSLSHDALQDDLFHGISAHYGDGTFTCSFSNVLDDSGRTIVDVTVAAFVSGRARTVLDVGGVEYYGTMSTKKHVAAWLETVYTTNPATSAQWTFEDIGILPSTDGIAAGADLRQTSGVEFPMIFGNESDPLPDNTSEWPTDPSMYFLDTTCYCVKLLVHYYLDSDPSTILELELLPTGQNFSSSSPLCVVYQNIINNGDGFGYPSMPTYYIIRRSPLTWPAENFYIYSTFQPEYLSYVDGESVGFAATVDNNFYAAPYLQMGDAKSFYWHVGSTKSAGSSGLSASTVYYCKFTANQTGYIRKYFVYATGPGNVKVAVYSDSGSSPSSRLGYTSKAVVAGWNEIDLGSMISVSDEASYWLAVIANSAILAYDSSTGSLKSKSATYSTFSYANPADTSGLSDSTGTIICELPIYYAADIDFDDTAPMTWDTNPITGAAWADGDLIEGDGCGIDFWYFNTTGYLAVGPLWPGISNYWSLYGDVTGTPGVWFVTSTYLGILGEESTYTNYDTKANLIGDMYRNDGGPLVKRFESDLSEIPPSFSQINNISVVASALAWTDVTENTYWRIFINIDGTRYYSDEYTLAGNPYKPNENTFSWDINPATSAAWNYDDFQGIMFGVEVTRESDTDFVLFRPYELYADVDYQAIKGPLAPAYHRLPAIESTISITKNSNTPKFKADELRCVLPVGYYQPERAEIVFVKDGAHIFHGFIWQADERPNKETQILAKAQSHALACRYIPSFFYHARNSRWLSVYTLAEVFSDDVPIYPNEFGWMGYSARPIYIDPNYPNEGGAYKRYAIFGSNTVLREPTKGNCTIYMLQGTHSNIGIFFLLNSMIPYGYAGDSDRYRDVAGVSYNRAKFLVAHNPSNIPKVENVGLCLADQDREHWGWNGTDPKLEFVVSDVDPMNISDPVGGVKRFRQGNPADLFYDEYAYSGSDLLVSHYPGVFMVLFDHALDTYLRPGEFELEDKYLAVPYVFNGSYASAFSDFFFRLGQEVWFRNSQDGYVYMDTGSELGRTATLQFMDGKNATVTKSVRDPIPAAVLGNDFQPRLSTDWMPARTWLTKLVITQRTGEDLQEWVDLLKDEDKSTWTIKTQDKLWHILPGDHVLAQARGQGLEDVRVRKAVISNAGTTLTCGKRLYDLSEEWGQWRSVKGSTDADTDMPVQEQEIDLGDADGSQTFTIKAEEYEIGSWKCKLEINWDLDVDEGYTADLASAPLGMFLVVKLNTKVLPPGRVQARGSSGSIEIDVTDYCTCSTSSDQTNTVAIKLWRAVSSTHYRHKITGAITQYRRLEAVDNA